MVGTFACPECGEVVEPAGLAPGRRVRCAGCDTLVEVPFLPRATQSRGGRWQDHEAMRRLWIMAAAVVGVSVLVVLVLSRLPRGSSADSELGELLALSRKAEGAGDLGRALAEADAALRLARADRPASAGRVDELRRRRDDLSRREAEARLTATRSMDAPRAIGEGLTLLARTVADPALVGLKVRVREELARRAAAEVEEARQELASAHPAAALTHCERAEAATSPLPIDVGGRIRDDAWDVARSIVGHFGVVVEPVRGQFTLGDSRDYDMCLDPQIAAALRDQGYLPRPAATPFAALWDGRSLHKLVLHVQESFEGTLLDTPQRMSRIEGQVTLGREGWPAWEARVTGKTRRTPPGIESVRRGLAVFSAHRDDKVEQLLYRDAREVLQDQLLGRLHTLPTPGRELWTPPGLSAPGRPSE